jgi:hypothetical protein
MHRIKNILRFSILVSLLAIVSEVYGLQSMKAAATSQPRLGNTLTAGAELKAKLLPFSLTPLIFPDPNAQYEEFVWVRMAEEEKYKSQGYTRIPAGILYSNGSKLDICRVRMSNGLHPGKIYKNQCLVPWGGKENIYNRYQILLVKAATIQWPNIQTVSAVQIQKDGIVGGRNNKEPLYICRMKLNDGSHPGKFLVSTNLCYVAWGGKEITATNGFEVLLRYGN